MNVSIRSHITIFLKNMPLDYPLLKYSMMTFDMLEVIGKSGEKWKSNSAELQINY